MTYKKPFQRRLGWGIIASWPFYHSLMTAYCTHPCLEGTKCGRPMMFIFSLSWIFGVPNPIVVFQQAPARMTSHWRIPVALSDLHCLGLVRSRAAIWALPTLVAALGTQLAKGFDKTCCGKQATRTRRELSIDYFYVTCGTIFDLCNVWVHLKMGILQIHKNGNVKRYSDN